MGLRPSLVRVSFDATVVAGARATRGLRSRRLQSFARVSLPEGTLAPSAHERNLLRPDVVRDALAQVARMLAAGRDPVVFLLPDGVARIVLLEQAPAHVRPEEYARYRLGPGLPYPVREAVVQAEAAGPGCILAAVAWRPVLAEYEEAGRAAGLAHERMDLAPLAGLHALWQGAPRSRAGVDVVLGDAAYALALHDGSRLRLVRNRRRDRDEDEPRRLALEVERARRLCGLDEEARVRVVGSGAPGLVRVLAAAGGVVEPGWTVDGDGHPSEAAELPWLGSLFA